MSEEAAARKKEKIAPRAGGGKGPKHLEELDSVTIRFAGDSGDGMQLTGSQFSQTAAVMGSDISTFPDFPAEIRAPAGSLPGVSGFQINFSSHDVRTPGDVPNVLVAMNPAALKVHLKDLEKGGTVIVNKDAFVEPNLRKAGYGTSPLEDDSLNAYRLFDVPITNLTLEALKDLGISKKEKERCKNFFALGLMYWLFDRTMDPTLRWIDEKFRKLPDLAEANRRALNAGWNYGETTEAFTVAYKVQRARMQPGLYRQVTGNLAIALGLTAAAYRAGKRLFYASYPITPASEILQDLSALKNYNVYTFQAEDEIAAIGAAIGASFGGNLGATGTSGPGMALKSEAVGLAVMAELPLVVINVQRGGPSTGLPTKTEQADLLQALVGRNGEAPVAVLAPGTPAECFQFAFTAAWIATKYMCPVIVLSDGYLANGSEPWRIPPIDSLPEFEMNAWSDPATFQPYLRDEKTLARPWVPPGTKGFEHRIGGLEKQDVIGCVSYDPTNHEKMVRLRAEKIGRIAQDVPDAEVTGKASGKLLVLSWGSTYGAVTTAVEELQRAGRPVSGVHLRYLNPLPRNLGGIIRNFEKTVVPELNLGQLKMVIRAAYLTDAVGLNKIQGQPFKIREVKEGIEKLL